MTSRSNLSTYFNIFLIIILFVLIQSFIFVIGPALRSKNIIDDKLVLFRQRYPYQSCDYQYTVHINTTVTIALCSIESRSYLVAMNEASTLLSALDITTESYQARIEQTRIQLNLSNSSSVQFSYYDQSWVVFVEDENEMKLYNYETRALLWKVRKV
jgi:NADH:ubiquinone oxidoreductase subunit 3 (subunit A)